MNVRADLSGVRFGRLTAIRFTHSKNSRAMWLCECDCGKTTTVSVHDLNCGDTKSCGCLRRNTPLRYRTHGRSNTPEYISWTAMKDRCCRENKNCRDGYHDRGITICERWIYSFENFFSDMGKKPEGKYSLDRIDNSGNYSPENCRWATDVQQANNSRNCHYIEHDGEVKSMKQWSDIFNMDYELVKGRIDVLNWDFIRAVTTPVRKCSHNKIKQ